MCGFTSHTAGPLLQFAQASLWYLVEWIWSTAKQVRPKRREERKNSVRWLADPPTWPCGKLWSCYLAYFCMRTSCPSADTIVLFSSHLKTLNYEDLLALIGSLSSFVCSWVKAAAAWRRLSSLSAERECFFQREVGLVVQQQTTACSSTHSAMSASMLPPQEGLFSRPELCGPVPCATVCHAERGGSAGMLCVIVLDVFLSSLRLETITMVCLCWLPEIRGIWLLNGGFMDIIRVYSDLT